MKCSLACISERDLIRDAEFVFFSFFFLFSNIHMSGWFNVFETIEKKKSCLFTELSTIYLSYILGDGNKESDFKHIVYIIIFIHHLSLIRRGIFFFSRPDKFLGVGVQRETILFLRAVIGKHNRFFIHLLQKSYFSLFFYQFLLFLFLLMLRRATQALFRFYKYKSSSFFFLLFNFVFA